MNLDFRLVFEKNLGLEICVNCKDAICPRIVDSCSGWVGYGSVSNGPGRGRTRHIIKGENAGSGEKCFFRVDILEEDFDEFEGMGLLSQSGESQEPDSKKILIL